MRILIIFSLVGERCINKSLAKFHIYGKLFKRVFKIYEVLK